MNHRNAARFGHRALVILALLFAPSLLSAATITVNGTGDTTANDGVCTLREAITSANTNIASGATAGECSAGQEWPTADEIRFNITGGCATVCTITPATSFPPITDPIDLNGYSQPGASPNTLLVGSDAVLKIEIDGSTAGGTGLQLAAGSVASTIRGLVINRFADEILIQSNSNIIRGNFIGIDATGMVDLGNTGDGIKISAIGNSIGGVLPGDRNVISGNAGPGSPAGIFVTGVKTLANFISNNYIGTNAAGNAAIPNYYGINVEGADEVSIGGVVTPGDPAATARNVISGNLNTGVRLSGSNDATIVANYIGTNASGTAALGNGNQGLHLDNSNEATVGASLAGAGNVISANGDIGVRLTFASNTVVEGNVIGMDATATAVLGNAGGGVHIFGGTGNRIRPNVIFGNDLTTPPNLGIDLDVEGSAPDDGPTPNDPGDSDSGSNNLQNFPILTSAILDSGTITLFGTFNSTPSTSFTLDFFLSNACDPSGFGEGQTPIGAIGVTTDASGNATFGPEFFDIVVARPFATATATHATSGTSEFSPCLTVLGAPTPTPIPTTTPTPTFNATPTTVPPSATPTQLGGGGGPAPGDIPVPTLSEGMLALLTLALAGVGFVLIRRQ